MIPMRTSSGRQCSVLTVTAALVLAVAITASCVPSGARASAIRPAASTSPALVGHGVHAPAARLRRDAPAAAAGRTVVRRKRTLLKLKPLVVLPAKLALGAGAKAVGLGAKLVTGAKLGAKAVGVGAKALGVGVVGLKAVKKVAKVTIKAATALGIKAVLLNFLFQVSRRRHYGWAAGECDSPHEIRQVKIVCVRKFRHEKKNYYANSCVKKNYYNYKFLSHPIQSDHLNSVALLKFVFCFLVLLKIKNI